MGWLGGLNEPEKLGRPLWTFPKVDDTNGEVLKVGVVIVIMPINGTRNCASRLHRSRCAPVSAQRVLIRYNQKLISKKMVVFQ